MGTGDRVTRTPSRPDPVSQRKSNAGLPRDSNPRSHGGTEEAEPPPARTFPQSAAPGGIAVPAGPQTLSHGLRDWAAASHRPMGGVVSRRGSARLRRHLAGAGRRGTDCNGRQRVTVRPRHAALPGLGGVHSRRGEALPRRSHEGGWRQRRAE